MDERLEALLTNYEEVLRRVVETKNMIERATSSPIKWSTYPFPLVISSLLLEHLGNLTTSRYAGSGINLNQYSGLLVVLSLAALSLSVIFLISHYIWRIGNVTHMLSDLAALIFLERQISELSKGGQTKGITLSTTLNERMNVLVSPIIASFWSFFPCTSRYS